MSQNHPHDNIYSILGKLDALKPTTKEVHDATVKQIYESVESQGSILKGLREISPIEAKLSQMYEGEKVAVKGGTVHKGTYGYETDVNSDGTNKTKHVPKKGQKGRPKKERPPEFNAPKGDIFGRTTGKVPKSKSKGEVVKGKAMSHDANNVKDDELDESMFGSVDHASVAANLAKLARVIKSVQTPEQFAVAQKYAQRMSGTIQQHQHAGMGFGPGLRANIGVSRDIQKDLKAKAAELGIEYKALEEKANNPYAVGMAQAMKSTGDKPPLKKSTINKAHKIAKKIDESRDHTTSEYTYEVVGQRLAKDNPSMDTNSTEFFQAVYDEMIEIGMSPRAARNKLNFDEDFLGDVATSYAHFCGHIDETSLRGQDYTELNNVKPAFNTGKGQGAENPSMLSRVGGAVAAGANKVVNALGGPTGDELTKHTMNKWTMDEESQDLDDLARLAGLTPECELEEAEVVVDKPKSTPVNKPDAKYMSMKASTLNPGEGDAGEKIQHPNRPTFKNGDNAMAKPANESVLALETKLAAEYESIKKVTR